MTPRLITDLEALGVGVIAGVVSYFLSQALNRYMARRTSQKRQQALAQATAQLELVERLNASDRATILFGFKILCFLFASAGFGEFASHLLTLVGGAGLPATVGSIVWGIVTILSGYFAFFFHELDRPEEASDKLRTKISQLKDSPPVTAKPNQAAAGDGGRESPSADARRS